MRNVSSTAEVADTMQGWGRWGALSGVVFVIVFIVGIGASSPPSPDASDQKWTANYTGRSNQISHLVSGLCLILAALCLLSFLTLLWSRIADARRPASLSPLPLVAACMAATCIAIGGVLMAGISGTELGGGAPPLPNADLLRFSDYMGFVMVGVAGMIAASFSIAGLSLQARASGVFGNGLSIFSLVVAIIILFSFLFVPIVALFVWLVVLTVVLMRRSAVSVPAPLAAAPPPVS
ncbi:MAG TPA: hypothetical protein VHV31_15500 [Nitrolancea sp.]|nr:hypothetical protein [Nitrolancea sp.]